MAPGDSVRKGPETKGECSQSKIVGFSGGNFSRMLFISWPRMALGLFSNPLNRLLCTNCSLIPAFSSDL